MMTLTKSIWLAIFLITQENVFDWYTNSKSNLIDNWEELEHEFFNYSSQRKIWMLELTKSSQFKEEFAIDYTNHWRTPV